MAPEGYLTGLETLERLSISSDTMYAWLRRGLLQRHEVNGRLYFVEEEVAKLSRFTVEMAAAMQFLGMVRAELLLWATQTPELGMIATGMYRRYFNSDDVKRLKRKLAPYIKVGEAEKQLGVPRAQIDRLIELDEIPHIILGRYRYVLRQEVEKIANDRGDYSTAEAAAWLGLTYLQLNYRATKGDIPYTLTPGGNRRFHKADLKKYRAKQRRKLRKKKT